MACIERLLTFPQYLLPQHALSRLARRIARSRNRTFKKLLIKAFMAHYDIDLTEASRAGIDEYDCFNDFFTRALRPGCRPSPAEIGAIGSPADGRISDLGPVVGGRLLQAKGRDYSLRALLAGDKALEDRFTGGSFVTIYLAPHNYHRVHAPLTGRVSAVRYIPGRLFSVNARTARSVENLYARNERLIVEMQSEAGCVALILVGAMLVGSMELTFCDVGTAIESATGMQPFLVEQNGTFPELERGAELGRFNMGSTVIVLAEPGRIIWDAGLTNGDPVRVGQRIALRNPG